MERSATPGTRGPSRPGVTPKGGPGTVPARSGEKCALVEDKNMLLALQVTLVVVAVVLVTGAIMYLIDKTLDR